MFRRSNRGVNSCEGWRELIPEEDRANIVRSHTHTHTVTSIRVVSLIAEGGVNLDEGAAHHFLYELVETGRTHCHEYHHLNERVEEVRYPIECYS